MRFSPNGGADYVDVCPLCRRRPSRTAGSRRERRRRRPCRPSGGAGAARAPGDDHGHAGRASRGADRARADPAPALAERARDRRGGRPLQRVAVPPHGRRDREEPRRAAASRSSPLSGVNADVVVTVAWEISWYQYRVIARLGQAGAARRARPRSRASSRSVHRVERPTWSTTAGSSRTSRSFRRSRVDSAAGRSYTETVIYCVVPRELEDELFDKMVEYYKDNPNVTVILDRRDGPDRRDGRRTARSAERRETRDRRRARAPGTFPDTDAARRRWPSRSAALRTRSAAWVTRRRQTFESLEPVDRRGDRLVPALDGGRTSIAPSRPRARRGRTGASSRRPSAATSSSASRRCSSARKPELTDLMTREMGKVKAEAGGDVQEAIDMSYYMGGEGRRLLRADDAVGAPRQVHDERADAGRRRRRDHAVELPDRDSRVEALPGARLRQHRRPEAGRGHAAASHSASSSCSYEAGLPEGVVKIVHGFGEEAGDALVRHPDVPVITFTGSRETGVPSRRPRPTSSSTSTSSSAARTRSS